MNVLQKWLIVLAVWFLAIGVLLNALHGRYKMAVISELSQASKAYTSARFDTWTGEVEVNDGCSHRWQKGSSYFVQELK